MQKGVEYYIGFDGGTDSLGWAITTPDYQCIKKHGKSLWGVRLFEAGKTADERRANRTARRRNGRKRWRLSLLKEIFADEIYSVDNSFFARLSESRYWEDDKRVDGADSLFHERTFTDSLYHRKYPTIYHLRNELMHCDVKPDLRLVYLAMAHMIKNRGNFLSEGQNLESARSLGGCWESFQESAFDALEQDFSGIAKNAVASVLSDEETNKKQKIEKLTSIFSLKDKQGKAIAGLLCGGVVQLSELFVDDELKKADIEKLSLDSDIMETSAAELLDELGEERFALLQSMAAIYNWSVFSRILPEGKTISQAKIETYNKHHDDLRRLKRLVKEHAPQKYNKIFRSTTVPNNYCTYVGFSSICGERKALKQCKKEDFEKFLNTELKEFWKIENPDIQALNTELKKGSLLPRLTSKDNGVIPYQAHLEELEKILENCKRFYSFLTVPDENGFTPEEKIKKLLTFRIPYYVGPLNDAHKEKGFSWIVKRKNEKILPWNFEDIVDENASEDAFIRRMTATCTYLIGEDVLPANSALYCRFTVLNELNNLRIHGEKISVELKQTLYNNLFANPKAKKITMSALLKELRANNIAVSQEDISGIDGGFTSTMGIVPALQGIFAENPLNEEELEKVIFALTVSGDSYKMLFRRIDTVLGDRATRAQKKKVCALKCSGWGRLSQKFLTEIYHIDRQTGVCKSITDMLWETNNNLMQLLSGEFDFMSEVEKHNQEMNGISDEFSYDNLVKPLFVSPSIKRSIWQTLKVAKEIEKIMGHAPARIFIEMARGGTEEQKGKRTVSRKAQLLELYKNCKDASRDWCAEIEGLSEDKLRIDKLYLYYTQMGRCMYTGEPINLDDLSVKTADGQYLYDIDHIYPQSKTKDDSLNNRVLVKKQANSTKDNTFPIPLKYRQPELWKMLLKKGYISKAKYNRLTRTVPFTEEELAGFINRQLVETRQSTKAVAQLLKQLYPDTQIVYVKSGLASGFRQEFDFVKCREVNDLHHAKDAYLNIVVGNVYYEKFTNNPLNFVRSGQPYSLNIHALFKDWDAIKNERIIWKKGEDGTLQTVRQLMAKNDVLVTRYCTETKGQLFDLMPVSKGNGQLPLKGSDPRLQNMERYGGYNKLSGAYFALVRYTLKGKTVKSLEAVPLYKVAEINGDVEKLRGFFISALNVLDVEILIPKIKFGALFKVDGYLMRISGRSGGGKDILFRSAVEYHPTIEQEKYIKKLSNFVKKNQETRGEMKIIPQYDKITAEENLSMYDSFADLLQNSIYAKRFSKQGTFLKNSREKFLKLPVESQVSLLMQILHLFQCNPVAADLSLIDGPKSAGILLLSSNISKLENISIINESVTGFYTNFVDLANL